MSPLYDVAIVGAGPAGSTTARILAKKGFKTAIIDRRSEIGVPIHCGELLPTPPELLDIFPRSKRLKHLGNVPKDLVTNKTSRTQLISPQGHSVEFNFGTNIIDRTKYDQYLANHAIDAGAEMYLQSTALNRSQNNQIRIKSKSGPNQVDATIVVGADGSNSLISKTLGNSYSDIRQLLP